VVHKRTSSSYSLADCIGLWSCLLDLSIFQAPLYLWSSYSTFLLHLFSLPFSELSLVWDWPLTWLTNHCHSVLWQCWLRHLTRKIVFEMTCVSGTLNPHVYFSCLTAVCLFFSLKYYSNSKPYYTYIPAYTIISFSGGAGDWEIMILYEGQHVDGSPFTVRVHDPGQVKVSGPSIGVVGATVVFASKNNRILSAFLSNLGTTLEIGALTL